MENPAPKTVAEIGSVLAALDEFWEHWGFGAWSAGSLAGVSRLQRFVKNGLLGPVAEYRARDCIVWNSGTEKDREDLWRSVRPLEDVMTQRFVFLVENPWPDRRIKSFFLGFQGYVEFFAYSPVGARGSAPKGAKDLTDLVDMGVRFAMTGRAAREREQRDKRVLL